MEVLTVRNRPEWGREVVGEGLLQYLLASKEFCQRW